MNNYLQEKKGVIFGVANERSIAWAIASKLHAAGALIIVSYQNERFARKVNELCNSLGTRTFTISCDVLDDTQILDAAEQVKKLAGNIDFIVHSIAFAPREALHGRYLDTTREAFRICHEVSVYSFTAIVKCFEQILNNGASIVTLTYQGSERVSPNYNVMGVAKAGLEASVRYLAYELGSRQIRVNAISAGPISTLAARGIAGFTDMLKHHQEVAPLKRNISAEEVANSALFLLSNLSTGITGQIIYVDAGYHIIAP